MRRVGGDLSFPKIGSGRIGGVAQPERARSRPFRTAGSAVRADNLYSGPDAYALVERRMSRVHKGSQASPLTMQRFYLIMPIQIGWDFREGQVRTPNGADALTVLARDQRIEILIADINMPAIAGHELAQKAKRVRDGLAVILISGREADSHGFPMIRKPFLQDDLRRVMKETTGLC